MEKSRCKPTYEGLKTARGGAQGPGAQGCKPTYEGLKTSCAGAPQRNERSCKPTYEGLKRDEALVVRLRYRVVASLPMRD